MPVKSGDQPRVPDLQILTLILISLKLPPPDAHGAHAHGAMQAVVMRRVVLSDLPPEWQIPVPERDLREAALRLGLPPGQSVRVHVVFRLPQVDFCMTYAGWLHSQPSSADVVACCIHSREDWCREAGPGSLARLKRFFLAHGRPDWQDLARVIAPVEASDP